MTQGQKIVEILVNMFVIACILFGYKPDGNVWAIYIQEGKLSIGDFWAALAVVYLFATSMKLIREELRS